MIDVLFSKEAYGGNSDGIDSHLVMLEGRLQRMDESQLFV